METLISEFIEELKQSGRSYANHRLALRIYAPYLKERELNVLHVKLKDAEEFQMYLCTLEKENGETRYVKKSVIGLTGCVSSFYAWLKRKKLVAENPFCGVLRVRATKELPKDIPKEEELESLLCSLRNFSRGKNLIERRALYKAHVIAELMYSTGMRINELEALRTGDVDLERNTVRIIDRKSRQERVCLLNEYAAKVLRIYIERMKEDVLFGHNGGSKDLLFGAKAHIQMWFNALLKAEAGKLSMKRFTSHYFRHALGCHLLRAGCDIRVVQELLGHKLISSTQTYTKVEKEDLRSVLDRFHPRSLKRRDE
jgi:site-specific recombinase XerD